MDENASKYVTVYGSMCCNAWWCVTVPIKTSVWMRVQASIPLTLTHPHTHTYTCTHTQAPKFAIMHTHKHIYTQTNPADMHTRTHKHTHTRTCSYLKLQIFNFHLQYVFRIVLPFAFYYVLRNDFFFASLCIC